MSKTALVTGATNGIGYELAKILAQNGHDLVLVARTTDKLVEIKSDFEKQYGIKIVNIPGDLSAPHFPQAIFDILNKQRIAVDILVNNAGFGAWGPYVKSDWDQQADMIQVNVTALAHLTRLFLPSMIERKSGRILNVASTAGFQPGPLMAVYYASKAFVVSFSAAVANEVKGTGVTVTTLCPGPAQSNFQAAAGISEIRLVKGRKIPTAQEVAAFGYKAMMAGKGLVVHGTGNRVLAFIARRAPFTWTVAVARWAQEGRR